MVKRKKTKDKVKLLINTQSFVIVGFVYFLFSVDLLIPISNQVFPPVQAYKGHPNHSTVSPIS